MQQPETITNHIQYYDLIEKTRCLVSTNGLIVNLTSIPADIQIHIEHGMLEIPANTDFINIHFFPGLFDEQDRGSFGTLRNLVQAISRGDSDLNDFLNGGIIEGSTLCLGFTNPEMGHLISSKLGFDTLDVLGNMNLHQRLELRVKELNKLLRGIKSGGYGEKPKMGDTFVYSTVEDLQYNIKLFLEGNKKIIERLTHDNSIL